MMGWTGVDGVCGAALDNGHYINSPPRRSRGCGDRRAENRSYIRGLQRRLIRRGVEHILAPTGEEKAKMRAALESLLHARKLDVTLIPTPGALAPLPERLAPTGCPDLDAALGGGLRRGHLSEITGAASSGRSRLAAQAMAAATARGEAVAIVDACDTFDPASAAAQGLVLSRVLWVRETGDAPRALKACALILQAGGFGLVVLDLADLPPVALRRFPCATWMRVARIIEGRETAAVIVGRERIARSAGGVTIALDATPARWQGTAHRARLFDGVEPAPRVVRAR